MENKRFGMIRGFQFVYQELAPKEAGKQGARKKLEIRSSVPHYHNDEMMEYLKSLGFIELPAQVWQDDTAHPNCVWVGMKKDGNVALNAYVYSGVHFHVRDDVASENANEKSAHVAASAMAEAN